MKHEQAFFCGFNGLELYYQRWLADVEPRAIIVIVHGIGEHSGRYANVVNALNAAGYSVYGYDHRGHGRSPGQRVYINNWGEYREDLKAFVDTVSNLEPGKPVFLYGHSLGGLIALDYLLHYPQGLKGAILSTPTCEPVTSKPYLIPFVRALSGILPRFSTNPGLDVTKISRDADVVKAYVTDPLVSRTATIRFGNEVLNTIGWVRAHASEACIPILLIHGKADGMNQVKGTQYLFDAIRQADKTLIIYPGGYHEPHNDIEHDRVMADVREWLDRHLD